MKKRALSLILAAALFALCACSCSIFQDGDTAPTHIQTPVTLEPTTAPPTEPDPVDEEIAAMSLEEKVGQLFLVTCPDEYAAQYVTDYHLGGVVLFGRHVEGKTADELKDFIAGLQSAAKVPLLIAADEEGGTVVRVSDNPNLRADGGFWSPKDYFSYGGWEAVGGDNVPIDPVVQNYPAIGTIFVIYCSREPPRRIKVKDYDWLKVTEIIPSIDTAGLFDGTTNFSYNRIRLLIDTGYEDTVAVLKGRGLYPVSSYWFE